MGNRVGVIVALLCASVLIWILPLLVCGVRAVRRRLGRTGGRRSGVSRMLVFSACLIASIWCLRFAVGYYSCLTAAPEDGVLTWWEEVVNSALHALQTFSMDEDYTEYIVAGKRMMCALAGESTAWATVYGLYASALNLLAPIVGGAVIFELLVSIFPRLRLRLSYLMPWRRKYYFSELNDRSLALAESLAARAVSVIRRPVLIFTDAYTDTGDEQGAERLAAARAIGAICVQDDLTRVVKNSHGERSFFLMDEAEEGNLLSLSGLSSAENCACLRGAEVFYFTNEDAYVQIERNMFERLSGELGFTEEELPAFIPVRSHRNMISRLLTEVPLYEPLIGKKTCPDGKRELTVTILGTGEIGTEMFLSTYWFGQLLDCRLRICILSEEAEESFWGRIDYLNPEIRRTTQAGDPILQIDRRGDMAPVYAEVTYVQCDIASATFIDCLTDSTRHVLGADYFLVALGADEKNISVANTVRQHVQQYHLETQQPLRTVIAYVVYNNELSEMLNQTRFFFSLGDKRMGADVYMQAIGALQEVYDVRNVLFSDYTQSQEKLNQTYTAQLLPQQLADTHRQRLKDDYKYWANLARRLHGRYKVYSAGLFSRSLFDCYDSREVYDAEVQSACGRYRQMVAGEVTPSTPEEERAYVTLLHRMSWLEHRRWNAFTRVKGFRCTAAYDAYAQPGAPGSYKRMDIGLHPCLVECDERGIRARVTPAGITDTDALFRMGESGDLDLLDELSRDLYRKKYNDYDFKIYDYLFFDTFDD